MGNVSSRLDEGASLVLRDQDRFSVAGLTITNSRNRTLVNISPNAFPATRYAARRDIGDELPIDFVQDPDSNLSGGPPSFLLRLLNDDELTFNFTCVLRQQSSTGLAEGPHVTQQPAIDTQIAGLTYIFASSAKEIDQLVTREFHADPNLHKNPNVQLVGDYNTSGSASVQFQWSWRWRPPKQSEDLGGGWRNTCSFVEYDQRAHKLNTLASFSFWVQNAARYQNSPQQRSPRMDTLSPQRLRVPSAQSIESRMSTVSDSDGQEFGSVQAPQSPSIEPIPEYGLGLIPSLASSNGTAGAKFDVNCVGRPGEDLSTTEDGPLFRATMKSLELKTGSMRSRMKKVLRAAEAAESAQNTCNDAVAAFMEALRDASSSNANAVRPAFDHYFEKIAKEILLYERQNAVNLQKLIIEPVSRLYNYDIKQAESKKRDFEEESKDYYAYVGKYLGQRTESLKEKKRVESDSKYQSKRRTFELKRFDYSSFMHDLHGGRKDQEVLSQLTRYADAQAKGFLKTAKKVEDMVPQLDALCLEVNEADKEFKLQRTEREEKRRALEKNPRKSVGDPDLLTNAGSSDYRSDNESSRFSASRNSYMGNSPPSFGPSASQTFGTSLGSPPGSNDSTALPLRKSSSKFRGIRDLEEKDPSDAANVNSGQHRKEGLLWSLSRPGNHIDPKALTKTAWHKFWIVLDQGKLSEYVNWKDKLDLHMEPIDLRVASVREARTSERRFCFEVITPQFTRVYQAPSEEDMKSWIGAINNALQSAFENKSMSSMARIPTPQQPSSTRKDIAAVLTGKSSSFSGHRAISSSTQAAATKSVARHATTGDKPTYLRPDGKDSGSSELLNRVREADQGNKYCADCNSESKTEWCSINLGIVLCIECSGIHRSLGTHISKVRSLTLDTSVFTPDIIDLLLLVGNRVSNMIWEAKLDRFLKPAPHSTREQRLHFITSKYSDRAYVSPYDGAPSHSIDESLLTSIKRNDIQSVLYALAQRANPNSLDRSRSTHAVYLALAAADPAAPGSSFSHSRGTSTSTINPVNLSGHPSITTVSPGTTQRPSTPQRKPFPVAELLLQNGADIPATPAPIPLSRAAQMYIDFKIDQRTGRHLGVVAPKEPGGDALGALPLLGLGSSGGLGSLGSQGGGGGGGHGGTGGGGGGGVGGIGLSSSGSISRRPVSSGFVGGVKALGEAAGRR